MKIIKWIKRRIHRIFHPSLEECARRFTTYNDWAFYELDEWSMRLDKLLHPFRKDRDEE